MTKKSTLKLLENCNNILQQSIDNNKVSNELGIVILHMIDITYKQTPKNFSKLVEEEIRGFALLRILKNFKYWNKEKSSAKSFLIFCIRRYMKDYIKNYIEDHMVTDAWDDELEIGIWDDSFDEVRYAHEVPDSEPIERAETVWGSLRSLTPTQYAERRKAQQRIYYEKRKLLRFNKKSK
jgi:hypothetical protein